MGSRGHWMIVGVCALVSMLFGVGIGLAQNNQDQPEPPAIPEQVIDQKIKIDELETPPAPPQPVITHLDTPKTVKALYMSAWVASAPSLREKIIKLADDSEINAIVIDIKDATGRVSFMPNDQLVTDTGSPRELIKNISDFINTLHAKHIYVIGRIAVFQDPFLTKEQPDCLSNQNQQVLSGKTVRGYHFWILLIPMYGIIPSTLHRHPTMLALMKLILTTFVFHLMEIFQILRIQQQMAPRQMRWSDSMRIWIQNSARNSIFRSLQICLG